MLDHVKWAERRKIGRIKYILLYGAIGWGVASGFLWSLIMAVIFELGTFLHFIAYGLTTFPIGGLFFGACIWWVNEKEYAKEIKR